MTTTMKRAIAGLSTPDTLLPAVARILVISGDSALQKVLKRLFSLEGYEVSAVPDSLVGLDKLFQLPLSAVILEVADPDSSDFALRGSIATLIPDLPLIILAAASEVVYKDNLLKIGGDDFLSMPFSPKELLERVRALIKDRRTRVSFPYLCAPEANYR